MPDCAAAGNRPTIVFVNASKFQTGSAGFCVAPAVEDEFALVFCVNGDAVVTEYGIQVERQQALLMRLRQPIHMQGLSPSHTIIHIRFACAGERTERIPEWDQRWALLQKGEPTVIPSTGNVYRLLTEILYECFRQGAGYKRTCTHLLEIILSRLLCGSETPKDQEWQDYAEKVRRYLEQRYLENVCLQEIAQYFWVSVSYLQKQFKQRYGMTMIAWLNRYRYLKAAALMEKDHISMKEALYRSGIAGRQQYYRLKKIWGNGTPHDEDGGEP